MNRAIAASLIAVLVIPYALFAQAVIRIDLNPGYNMISSNLRPAGQFWAREEGPDVRRLFGQFGAEDNLNPMVTLSNLRGRFYAPRFRFNNIDYWNLTEGYFAEMAEARQISWEGEFLPANTVLPLTAGWNMVSYFPDYELDASAPDFHVLSPAIDNIVCAADGRGGFMLPEYDFSNMAPWEAGRGYIVRASAAVNMQYPEEPDENADLFQPLEGNHWARPPISKYLMFVLINEIIGGEALDGDMIAAYGPDNRLVGCGTVQDDRCGITVVGTTQNVPGIENNEDLHFVYWLSDQNRELNMGVGEILDGSIAFSPFQVTVLSLEAEIGDRMQQRVVQLNQGWNLTSVNITPEEAFFVEGNPGPDVVRMLTQLNREGGAHRVIRAVDAVGRFFVPSHNFNQIPYWNLDQAIWICVDEAASPEWTGRLIPADSPIELRAGWNLMAYFPNYRLDASAPDFYALSPIIDNVQIAKDDQGHFILPAQRFSNMEPWKPGEGYQVRIREAAEFSYPAEQDRRDSPELAVKGTHWNYAPKSHDNMSVLVTEVAGVRLMAGDQIAAIDEQGRLVGVGDVSNSMVGLAVWGCEEAGMKAGDVFSLKVWQEAEGVESRLVTGESLVYTPDGVIAIPAVRETQIPATIDYLRFSPNPFNATAHIEYALPKAGMVRLGVYNLQGAEVALIKDEMVAAGSHAAVWNAAEFPSGIYLLRLDTPNGSVTTRGVLIK